MKLGTFSIQPGPAQYVFFSGAVAVVAGAGTGIETACQFMAGVAHVPFYSVILVAVAPVNPVGPQRYSAAVWSEMACKTPRYEFTGIRFDVVAFQAVQYALKIHFRTVEGF